VQHRGAGLDVHDQPGLALAALGREAPAARLGIRVYLDADVLLRVDELHQQRELLRTPSGQKLIAEARHDLAQADAGQRAIGDGGGAFRHIRHLP